MGGAGEAGGGPPTSVLAGGGPPTFVEARGRKSSRSCPWGQAETWGELGGGRKDTGLFMS